MSIRKRENPLKSFFIDEKIKEAVWNSEGQMVLVLIS